MYVCVCNAYRKSELLEAMSQAAQQGADSVEQVYALLGGRPRCGKCLMHARDLMNGQTAQEPQSPPPSVTR